MLTARAVRESATAQWNRARRKQLRTKCHAIAARCHGIGAPQHGNARHIAPITGNERRLEWHLAIPTWHLKAMGTKRERNHGLTIPKQGMGRYKQDITAVTASERQLQTWHLTAMAWQPCASTWHRTVNTGDAGCSYDFILNSLRYTGSAWRTGNSRWSGSSRIPTSEP